MLKTIIVIVVLGLLFVPTKTDEAATQDIAGITEPPPIEVIETPQPIKKVEAKTKTIQQKQKLLIEYTGKRYSKDEVIQLIKTYSAQYGILSDKPLCIALGESGYQDTRISPSDKYHGVFQYDLKTWAGTDEGKAGRHVLDADANVKAAIKFMASRGHTNPWPTTSKKCPYPLHK